MPGFRFALKNASVPAPIAPAAPAPGIFATLAPSSRTSVLSSETSPASSTRTTLARVAQDVKGALGTGDTATAVVISADRQVKYESVVKVMDTLQRAGIQRIGLSVQLAPGGDKR